MCHTCREQDALRLLKLRGRGVEAGGGQSRTSLGGNASESGVAMPNVSSFGAAGSRPHIVFILVDDWGWPKQHVECAALGERLPPWRADS